MDGQDEAMSRIVPSEEPIKPSKQQGELELPDELLLMSAAVSRVSEGSSHRHRTAECPGGLMRDEYAHHVTGCRFAQCFRDLGEPELGAIMTCEIDGHVAALGYPEVEVSRPQTIMGGAEQCHFRYSFRKTRDK